jgi:sodium/bile acid cotransporter 7
MLGLLATAGVVLADTTGILTTSGVWLKEHGGPGAIIIFIFFLSGLSLNIRDIRQGLMDTEGTLAALTVIILVSPLLAVLVSLLPLPLGILLGIFLVASMPTTLSSGVVMTGKAGGNMAHALLITILANALAVFTIPIALSLLLKLTGESRAIEIDQLPIMIKLATNVLLPLTLGIVLRQSLGGRLRPILPYCSTWSQLGILLMVWMALCSSRPALISGLPLLAIVVLLVFLYHLLLLLSTAGVVKILGLEKGRRESVIFMGAQKTLPLSVIIQVTLFPGFAIALVVCVVHHIIHLIMDAALIPVLAKKE